MTAYTASNPVPMTALPTTSGVVQQFLVGTTNTGSSTFAPDGLAAAPIFGLGGAQLQGGEIVADGIATLVSYVGTLLNSGSLCWVLFSCTGGTEQVGMGTGSQQAATVGQIQKGSLVGAAAAGTANALTATIASTLTSLTDGQPLTIVAASANTAATTLALTLGTTTLSTLSIVKGNNQALNAGDIPAAGYPIELNYSATFGAYVMQNPATGIFPTLGLVGSFSNAKMSVTTASASATFTADQIIVGTALNGVQYLLSSYSETINLATTGAGGMDTGSAPTSGYVALYAIYNHVSGATSILATNATSAVAPTVYSAGHMPSGYTASALIAVVPTNTAGNIPVLLLQGRKVTIVTAIVLNSPTVQSSITALSVAGTIPPNAKSVSGVLQVINNSLTAVGTVNVYGSSAGVGEQSMWAWMATDGTILIATYSQLDLAEPQTLYYMTNIGEGSVSAFQINISAYWI